MATNVGHAECASEMAVRRLLFIVNVDWFFLSHRVAIARAARAHGYEVHVACTDTGRFPELHKLGFFTHPIPDIRTTSGVLGHFSLAKKMYQTVKRVAPDVVHLVTIKPVLIGGMVTRLTKTPVVVAAISGMGFAFISKGPLSSVRRLLIHVLYRLSLRSSRMRVIFQNRDDMREVSRFSSLDSCRAILIPGSGVDLKRFAPHPMPSGLPAVVFAARLLKDKGIVEFVSAASDLLRDGIQARFIVAGSLDPENPASLGGEMLERWTKETQVEFRGQVIDMPALYREAALVVLPSYREGMPLSLLEAAASGRAVVTTDVPGCRDAIEPGVTGLLVPPRDARALKAAIKELVSDRDKLRRFGQEGRRLAERKFDIQTVIQTHLDIYGGKI